MPVLSQKGRGTKAKKKNSGGTEGHTVSLAPLGFDQAIRAALATGKAPPLPKKPKPKGKK